MHPSQTYFICFTVRSGSSLLCQLLIDTGIAGKPQEQFNHNINPDNPQGDSIPDYKQHLHHILHRDTTPNGVFGTKIGGGIWHDFVRRIQSVPDYQNMPLADTLETVFPNLQYIWLTRRNKVRQAVSHWMAIQSGRWGSSQVATNPNPEYNFEAIDYLVQELVIRDAVWGDYFADNHITPHVIVYEDYIQNTNQTVMDLLNFLNITTPTDFSIPQARLARLADEQTEDWVQRYRKEKQQSWWTTFW